MLMETCFALINEHVKNTQLQYSHKFCYREIEATWTINPQMPMNERTNSKKSWLSPHSWKSIFWHGKTVKFFTWSISSSSIFLPSQDVSTTRAEWCVYSLELLRRFKCFWKKACSQPWLSKTEQSELLPNKLRIDLWTQMQMKLSFRWDTGSLTPCNDLQSLQSDVKIWYLYHVETLLIVWLLWTGAAQLGSNRQEGDEH